MLTPAASERANLAFYTQQNANTLVQDEIMYERNRDEFSRRYIFMSLGQLACNLAKVGEDEAALQLVDSVLTDVKANNAEQLHAWSSFAENGAVIADTSLRQLMGLQRDDAGNTIIDGQIDFTDARDTRRLLSLYKFGDSSLLPYLHKSVEFAEGDRAQWSVRLAVELYSAGDETAYDLITSMAKRAQAYAFSQGDQQKELSADDASDFRALTSGLLQALVPPTSETERLYSQADIALKYFAQRLLKSGDIMKADEIQSLILSSYTNAWVCAQRFELGYDVDGRYVQAAKDYIAIYAEDAGDHALEITNALVRGGDADMIAEYELAYDPTLIPEHANLAVVADMLVALHHSGDARAHDRLIELLQGSGDTTWKLIYSLEDMGFTDEAVAIAQAEFNTNPNYNTGLTLLNLRYSADAMRAVQNEANEYDRTIPEVIYSRARHLGKLAAHINELESEPHLT